LPKRLTLRRRSNVILWRFAISTGTSPFFTL